MPNEDETDAQHRRANPERTRRRSRLDYRLDRPRFEKAPRAASHRRRRKPAGFQGQPIARDAANGRSAGGNPNIAFVSSVRNDVG